MLVRQFSNARFQRTLDRIARQVIGAIVFPGGEKGTCLFDSHFGKFLEIVPIHGTCLNRTQTTSILAERHVRCYLDTPSVGESSYSREVVTDAERNRVLESARAYSDPFPCRLTTQELVDLLKLPTCRGAARRLILDHLENRYHQKFDNHWAFVRYATEQKFKLDLTTPPHRPEPVR